MAQDLNEDGCMRLLSAVVLQWWREADDLEDLAYFLDVPDDQVRGVRPRRIDVWRRRRYVAVDDGRKGEDDVYF